MQHKKNRAFTLMAVKKKRYVSSVDIFGLPTTLICYAALLSEWNSRGLSETQAAVRRSETEHFLLIQIYVRVHPGPENFKRQRVTDRTAIE